MLRAAVLVLLLSCAVPFAPTLPTELASPEVLAAAIATVWLLWGPVPGIAVATTAWSILNIGWALEQRLTPALAGRDLVITGSICDFPRQDRRARRFVLHLEPTASDPALPGRIYLASYGVLPDKAEGGQRWRLKVRLKRPRGTQNPGGFDFERWTLTRRLGATGYVRPSAINRQLGTRAGACQTMALRQRLANDLARAVGPSDAARFLPALAVGARHRLTTADWRVLRRTGTVHLMAISGLHIGLVAGLLFALGRGIANTLTRAGIRCSPLLAGRILAVAGAAAYAALAGFAVPTTRALVMVIIAVLLISSRRGLGGFRIIGAAAIAALWADPFALIGMGFWLSFGAVGVLLVASLSIPAGAAVADGLVARLVTRVRTLVRVQLLLGIGLAPLTLLFFAEIPLVAPLTNLVLVPAFALCVLPLTLLGTVGMLIAPAAVAPALGGVAALFDVGLIALERISAWPGAAWQGTMPPGAWSMVCAAGVMLLVWPRPLPGRWLAAMCLIPIVSGLPVTPVPALRVVVLDVGQGLAVLVQTSDHALLFDAGPAYGDRDAGQSIVLPALKHFGVTKLDVLLVSHGDSDHIGGARTVLAAHPDARLIATESFGLNSRRAVNCVAGLRWHWDGIDFQVLHPVASAPLSGDNDRSCVLSVSGPGGSVLLPGDIERRAEQWLVDSHALRRHDIVVAPHHGSATSSSRPFIATVAPRIVVFSAGFANRWGFPAAAVRERWRQSGACPVTTALAGALTFETAADGRLRLVAGHRATARRVWTAGGFSAARCDFGASTN